MGFPNNLLTDDEQVVIHLHPHWKTIFLPMLWLVLIGAAAGAAVVWVGNMVAQLVIVGIAVIAICYLTVRPILQWLTTHFVVTTHRVLLREGILNRAGRDVPLARINDVSFQHSLFERMLGCGTLVVESAGERGQVVLSDIPRVEYVQSTLYKLVEDDQERRTSGREVPAEGEGI